MADQVKFLAIVGVTMLKLKYGLFFNDKRIAIISTDGTTWKWWMEFCARRLLRSIKVAVD